MKFTLSKKYSEESNLFGSYLSCPLTPELLEELDTLKSLGFFGKVSFGGGYCYMLNKRVIVDVDLKVNTIWLNSAFFEFEK